MKSTMIAEPVKATIDYPKLMESTYYIVLFTEKEKGTFVHIKPYDSKHYKIGKYHDYISEDDFKDYDGPITIQND